MKLKDIKHLKTPIVLRWKNRGYVPMDVASNTYYIVITKLDVLKDILYARFFGIDGKESEYYYYLTEDGAVFSINYFPYLFSNYEILDNSPDILLQLLM